MSYGSYGDLLASAAAALARAHAALRDPPPGPAARASAAMSRVRVYRSLEQHIVAVGNVHSGDLPPLGQPPPSGRPVASGSPVTTMAIALRHAAASTISANATYRVDPPTAGTVATALRDAYQTLQTAGDILISNTGPHLGPGIRHRPLTPEGMAVLAGVGRPDNLAVVARLAAAAADMDVRLTRWMWPEDAPADLRPLLAAAEQDAWQTKNGPLRASALLVAAGGDARRAVVRDLVVAPPVDDPARWAYPSSGHDCVTAIDAARSWLTRYGNELTVGQLASTARAALAITHHTGHIHLHLAAPGTAISTELIATAARPWRDLLHAVTGLRSPAPARTDHSTLTVAAGAAAAWLRSQLRPDGQWLAPAPWASGPTARAQWRETAGQITVRMPDLTDLLLKAIGTVQARGGVLAGTGRLNPRSSHLVHATEWKQVPAEHRSYRALRTALTAAATQARELAAAVGVRPRTGLDDARTARRQDYALPPKPARLAGQWYPEPDGMAESTVPSSTGVARPSGQPRPGRGRAR